MAAARRDLTDIARRMAHATKVAVAATLAWLVLLPWDGAAETYPYYAPLGAVIVFADTVTGSVRNALSSVGAIAVGAVLAVVAIALPVNAAGALAAVVLVGTWISRSWRLGPLSSWVPISAIFVLIIGKDQPVRFLTAYIGLVAVGAAIGLVLDMVWPSLPLRATQSRIDSLQHALGAQLAELASGLRAHPLPTGEEWQQVEQSIDSRTAAVDRMVLEVSEARRGNWRAGRWRESADRQHQQARALGHLSFLVRDVFDLVSQGEQAERARLVLGPALRPSAATALDATSTLLFELRGGSADNDTWLRTERAVEAAARTVRRHQAGTEEELFVAGSIVMTLRRVLRSVEPRENDDPAAGADS